MPKKIRELKKALRKAGFSQEKGRGKGSHTVWTHPLYNDAITLSGQDGKDAKKYQEEEIRKAIEEVNKNENQ